MKSLENELNKLIGTSKEKVNGWHSTNPWYWLEEVITREVVTIFRDTYSGKITQGELITPYVIKRIFPLIKADFLDKLKIAKKRIEIRRTPKSKR